MPQGVDLRPWFDYEPTWLILGVILAVLVIGWYVFVFLFTRRQKPKTIANLPPKPYTPPDLTALKAKYLQLIDEVERANASSNLPARQAHQKLSYLLRMFAYETRGHRVDTLTLDDLKKTRYAELTEAIEKYYLPEFSKVQRGDLPSAISLAKKVVSEWS